MNTKPLPINLTDPLALSLLLLGWLRDELPAYVQFRGPVIPREQKATFLMLLSGPPAIRFPEGGFFVETWDPDNPIESEEFADFLGELMTSISQVIGYIEKDDGFVQFHLINHYRIEDESIFFTASEEVTSDLEQFPDRRDALRAAAMDILGKSN